jgi:16S rRNA (cytosine1402-N4)-methyltransferase
LLPDYPRKGKHFMRRPRRSTPAGEHRPVLLDETLAVLNPQPGHTVVDCTIGWAGHAAELLRRVGPEGRLIGVDLDADNLPRARQRLEAIGRPFALHHANFAGIQTALAAEGAPAVDLLLADLGMSSMQVDDAERGFSYVRDGPLDMRMDRTRGTTAAELLASMPFDELMRALAGLGDEPHARTIATAICKTREQNPISRTADLARIIFEAVETAGKEWRLHPTKDRWNIHPAARTFQVLRILVNRELANLEQLLRVLPVILSPGGRAAIISFHSGEDRRIKTAFREGLRAGVYQAISEEPIRASFAERTANPRSRSAKLRWAERTG